MGTTDHNQNGDVPVWNSYPVSDPVWSMVQGSCGASTKVQLVLPLDSGGPETLG